MLKCDKKKYKNGGFFIKTSERGDVKWCKIANKI